MHVNVCIFWAEIMVNFSNEVNRAKKSGPSSIPMYNRIKKNNHIHSLFVQKVIYELFQVQINSFNL